MRRLAAALVLLAAAVTVVTWRTTGTALGPVIAITPNEVDNSIGSVKTVDLSGRGEVAGVRDGFMGQGFVSAAGGVSFVQFDDGDREPLENGEGIGVSGNGCVAVVVRSSYVIERLDRCGGPSGVIGELPCCSTVAIAVNFAGTAAAIVVSDGPFDESSQILRVDAINGAPIPIPMPVDVTGAPLRPAGADLGVDIDDAGRVIVVPITNGQTTQVAYWTVDNATVDLLGNPSTGLWTAFPSISGDAQVVSFASNQPSQLGEAGTGPWVYALTLGVGLRLASRADGTAYYSSLSRDGTQLAYAGSVGFVPLEEGQQGPCPNPVNQLFMLEQFCPPGWIDVAYGPAPGLTGGFQTETVSLGASGQVTGLNFRPALSGNGQWIGWVSTAGDDLLGQNLGLNGSYHAFMRRRDPGIAIDPLPFAAVATGATTTGTTTVRNIGTTSIWIGSIGPAPGDFAHVGGSCVIGLNLPPGGTCTVDVQYTAPGAPVNGTLTVSEGGYQPASGVGELQVSVAVTTTLTLPPGTTTIPQQPGTTTTAPQVVTTTRPPTTAGSPSLQVDPTTVDFGEVAVGFASDPGSIRVTNGGNAAGTVQTSLTGANVDDFWVRVNGCTGTTLAVGASCDIEVLLVPRDGGVRTATLTLRAGPSVVNVILTGNGTFDPKLFPTPNAITASGITVVYGVGFPPGRTFTVEVLGTDVTAQGTADVTGLFRAPLSAVGKLHLGRYTLHVDGVPDTFDDVEAPLTIVLPTFRPQGPGGPAFGNSLIIARGH